MVVITKDGVIFENIKSIETQEYKEWQEMILCFSDGNEKWIDSSLIKGIYSVNSVQPIKNILG